MDNKIIEGVTSEQTVEVVKHLGLKKGAVIIAIAGAVGTVGYLAHRFVIKPIIKKVKSKKVKKIEGGALSNQQTSMFDDDEEEIEMPFPDEEA